MEIVLVIISSCLSLTLAGVVFVYFISKFERSKKLDDCMEERDKLHEANVAYQNRCAELEDELKHIRINITQAHCTIADLCGQTRELKSIIEEMGNMRAIELKPCPFCGSNSLDVCFRSCGKTHEAWIHCISCSVEGPEVIREVKDEANIEIVRELLWGRAVDAWNERRG